MLKGPKIESSGIDKLRFYVSVANAFTITKYEGFDPGASSSSPIGSGFDRGFYPSARTPYYTAFHFGEVSKVYLVRSGLSPSTCQQSDSLRTDKFVRTSEIYRIGCATSAVSPTDVSATYNHWTSEALPMRIGNTSQTAICMSQS